MSKENIFAFNLLFLKIK